MSKAVQELVVVDRCEMSRNIGFVKAFLEMLYGCYSGIGQDELSDDVLYLISDARDYLEKTLNDLKEKEVTT
ncbi:MAG: hypothetical protein KA113_09110 [Syntrophaceae bacterium]|nr:hypothetical protein [Syntrophaceae bacterium]